jgi:hypothetical protein
MNNPHVTTFQTSKEAYEWCLANNVVSHRMLEVFSVICGKGPINAGMVYRELQEINPSLTEHSITPRFAVLLRMGLIHIVDKRACPYTKRNTVFYEATNQLPTCTMAEAIAMVKGKPMVARLLHENEELKRRVKELEALVPPSLLPKPPLKSGPDTVVKQQELCFA